MRRLILAALVVLVVAVPAMAGTTVKTPSSSWCTWRTNGHILDGQMCRCERVTHTDGSTSIVCATEPLAELRRPIKKHAAKKPIKPVAKYGISTGALSHA